MFSEIYYLLHQLQILSCISFDMIQPYSIFEKVIYKKITLIYTTSN